MILEYPTLKSLSMNLTWRPLQSTEVQQHQSGAEFRVSYWVEPLWEWDLTYDLLREGFQFGKSWDEMRLIMGLFNASYGQTFGFKFFNTDDNQVYRQKIGTTDGVTTVYDLVRTYGENNPALGRNWTEHVGLIDTAKPFNLYIDSSVVAKLTNDAVYAYSLKTDVPVLQQLVFVTAPPAGHDIYVDMNYLYYARFKDGSQDFEKFTSKLWLLKKVTLRSLRSEVIS